MSLLERLKLRRPAPLPLREIAKCHDTTKARRRNEERWPSLAEVYEPYLDAYRQTAERVLEIGVESGGSLAMWAEYFPAARVYGVDLRAPKRAGLDPERITVIVGDQSEPGFRSELAIRVAPVDFVIDDGSHRFDDQRETLLALWPSLRPGGVYIVEDVHTSYREKKWGGGPGKAGTFMEWAKGLLDDVHAREHGQQPAIADLESVSFHYSAAILRKWNVSPPGDSLAAS